jgi:hypothetical protein
MAIKLVIGVWDNKITYNVPSTLADIMLNTTVKFAKTAKTEIENISCQEVFAFDDLNTMFDELSQKDYTHFVLLASGCIITNPAQFILGIKHQIDNNPGMCLSAQILHTGLWPSVNNPEFFTLHEQMLLLSKHAISDLIRDNFTFKSTVGYNTTAWRKIKRDDRNVHDDYTPIDIGPSSDTDLISLTKTNTFGMFEDLLQYCINTGWHIQNFNNEIRNSKNYSYHIDSPEKFIEYMHLPIELIEQNKDLMVRGHYEFLKKIKLSTFHYWGYNTEYPVDYIIDIERDCFVSLAAGPLPWIYLSKYKFASDTLVHFVDISAAGIEFSKWFLKNYIPGKFNNWSDIIDKFQIDSLTLYYPTGNKDLTNKLWNKYRDLVDENWHKIKMFNYKFTVENLITSETMLNSISNSKNPMIWFSNIFRYYPTFDKDYNNEDLEKFLNKLISSNRSVTWIGSSPENNKNTSGIRFVNSTSTIPVCIPVDIPKFDSEVFLKEIQTLEDLNLFTDHRGSQHPGWSSFVLHGLGYDKTLGYENYGYKNDAEAPYDWTAEALTHCPNIVEYFKASGIKKRYHRLRIMKLAPEGYISIHDDDPQNFKRQWALNIAVNNPKDCEMHFWNDDFEYAGQVPWAPEKAFLIRIHWKHMVMNLSDTIRYHIIVHGEN